MKSTRLPIWSGFFLSGLLLALPGAALPGSGFYLTEEHATAGWLFCAVGVGLILASFLPFQPRVLALTGCSLAALPLLSFGVAPAPIGFVWQAGAWLTVGFGSGLVNRALIESMGEPYRASPASAIAKSALSFLVGCLASALLVALGFHFGFVSQTLAALALLPIAFGVYYWHTSLSPALPVEPPAPPFSEFSRFSLFTITAALLLQCGSEWLVGGWVPVFLSHRIGLGPEDALWLLTAYWLALIGGLFGGWYFTARLPRGRILMVGVASVLAACFLLASTNNAPGASVGVVLLTLGFSGFSCLLTQSLSARLPAYHPLALNRLLTATLVGGLFSAWLAGLLASWGGLTTILILPAVNSLLVAALLLVLWLESKVTGR